MAILSIGSVSKSFGENTLFQNVSFSLEAKDKVGFIGSNGAGKTTLFKILTGSETPDSGTVSKSQQLSIGYMEQYALKNSETTLFDEVLKCFSYLAEIEAEHEKVTRQISLGLDIDEYIRKQHELSEKFEALGGLTYRSRTRSMLMGLGFTDDDMLLPVASLSGGEKTRASLAKLLLSGHNLLLLDEPTNHLDMEATAFLENYLAGFDGAIIVISHDRYFLDRVTTKTFELKNRRFTVFDGSYSVYSAFSKKNEAVLKKHYENDMREIHRIEGIIKQQRQWNRERNIKTAESKQKILDRKVAELVVPESEYQPCIAVQTHDTSLFPPKDTTGNTDSLLFLKIVLQRPVHQLDIVRHGFIQINKFFHLSMGNNSHAIGIAVFCKILPGEQMGKDEIQFIQRGTYKQITITRDFLFIRQSVQLLYRACRESLLYSKGGLPTGRIFFLAIRTPFKTSFMVSRGI